MFMMEQEICISLYTQLVRVRMSQNWRSLDFFFFFFFGGGGDLLIFVFVCNSYEVLKY